jgi:hypothetical protein
MSESTTQVARLQELLAALATSGSYQSVQITEQIKQVARELAQTRRDEGKPSYVGVTTPSKKVSYSSGG